jgi:hypothetical protein
MPHEPIVETRYCYCRECMEKASKNSKESVDKKLADLEENR